MTFKRKLQYIHTSWWFQPIWINVSRIGSFPQIGMHMTNTCTWLQKRMFVPPFHRQSGSIIQTYYKCCSYLGAGESFPMAIPITLRWNDLQIAQLLGWICNKPCQTPLVFYKHRCFCYSSGRHRVAMMPGLWLVFRLKLHWLPSKDYTIHEKTGSNWISNLFSLL